MALLICVACIFAVWFGYTQEKNYYNPITIFFTIWGIIIFLTSLQLFNIYNATIKAYICIFIGLLCFFFGSVVMMIVRQRADKKKTTKNIKLIDFNINYYIFYILTIIAFIVLINIAFKSIKLMISGYELYSIRYEMHEEIFANDLINVLYTYLVLPFIYLMIPITILDYFLKKNKRRKLNLMLSIALITLMVIGNGGRFIIINFILNFLVISLIVSKSKTNKKTSFLSKTLVIIVVCIGFYLIAKVSSYRESNFIENIYTYLIGSVTALGIKINFFDLTGSYTYGISSIQGFITPLIKILNTLGIFSSSPQLYLLSVSIIDKVQTEIIYVGNGLPFNAFVTLFYYFYIDFGIIGVAINSFLYGVLCMYFYFKLKYSASSKNYLIYLLFVQSLFISYFQFAFSKITFALSFFYVIFIVKKK